MEVIKVPVRCTAPLSACGLVLVLKRIEGCEVPALAREVPSSSSILKGLNANYFQTILLMI